MNKILGNQVYAGGAKTPGTGGSELPDPTGLADGTYVLKMTIVDGVGILTWVAE